MKNGSKKTFIVYKHTSKTTGLSYVGLTSQSLEDRFNGHIYQAKRGKGWKFHEAIRLYGKDDFESIILFACDTLNEAKEKETFFIQKHNTYNAGYNCNNGGWGGYNRTEETTKKQSETLKKSYKENKIKSPFADPEIHRKTIDSRTSNKSNIWLTNNPMKNKERALEIAAKRSGKNHYLSKKYRYIIYDGKTKKEFIECILQDVLDIYGMSAATFNKYVNTNSSPCRGLFKSFRMYRESIEN